MTDKTRVDTIIRSWLSTCPGPIFAWTSEECFKFVQSVIGDQYSIDEIKQALNRAGYVPSYRSKGNTAHYCLQLPDVSWLKGRR